MKIFVTLGSSTQNFDRLLFKIDDLIKNKIVNINEIVVQSNSLNYIPKNYKLYNHLSFDEYNKYLKWCDILITHGGVGSIMDGLFYNKKVIAFPRLKEYEEAVNDHQVQIVNKFVNEGYIISGEISNLDILFKNVIKFKPKCYVSNNDKFNNELINIIDML